MGGGSSVGCSDANGGLMGQIGFSEMLVIFVVALLVFGPKKLPELGKSLGKGIREFKKATRSEEHTSELQSRFDLVCRLLLEKNSKMKHKEKINEINCFFWNKQTNIFQTDQ